TAELVRHALPGGVSLLDHGDHELRGIGPRRIFQVLHPGLGPEGHRLIRTHPARLTNLPLRPNQFIGRQVDGDALKSFLTAAPAGPPLVTLTGAGGCGKTRLACEVAERLLPEFPAGVWLAD